MGGKRLAWALLGAWAIGGQLQPCGADTFPDETPRLEGGFIQIQGWMVGFEEERWREELRDMRAIGMDTVIIQYVEAGDRSYLPPRPGDPDPVGAILKAADDEGMRVFVGTRVDDGWWEWDAAYLDHALVERKRLVEALQNRYGEHRSFAGWYFTEECSGGLSAERVQLLRAYFSALSRHCKNLRDQPVAFAPYFSHITPVEEMREIYAQLLDGKWLDVMMVQDGVGARGWDDDLETRIVPFFRMFAEVCAARDVALWSDLESFRQGNREGGRFVPTDLDRIKRQMKAVGPFVSKIVTFDFFHYMSPRRGESQQSLYEAYREWYSRNRPSKTAGSGA